MKHITIILITRETTNAFKFLLPLNDAVLAHTLLPREIPLQYFLPSERTPQSPDLGPLPPDLHRDPMILPCVSTHRIISLQPPHHQPYLVLLRRKRRPWPPFHHLHHHYLLFSFYREKKNENLLHKILGNGEIVESV